MKKQVRQVFLRPPDCTEPVIFCFNHAGGNARAFSGWHSTAGAGFVPLEMPGHGIRSMEEPLTDIGMLADEYAEAIAEVVQNDAPFSLFGHSLGALIAFRTAQLLTDRYDIYPCCLQVSGAHAPHDDDPSAYRTAMGEEALIQEILSLGHTPAELFECREYRDYIMPLLMSDYRMKESFSYDGCPLEIPVYAYCGNNDGEAPPEAVKRWKEVTSAGFALREFTGDHFYLFEADNHVAEKVANDMLGCFDRCV